jgi:hypothetical protein
MTADHIRDNSTTSITTHSGAGQREHRPDPPSFYRQSRLVDKIASVSLPSLFQVPNHRTRAAEVARWRRIIVTADLLLIAALIAAGHLQEHAGQLRILTPSTVDSFLGAPTVLAIIVGAAAFWMASSLPAVREDWMRD